MLMHAKLEKATVERIVPILSELVAKETPRGRFNIENPTETVEFLVLLCLHLPPAGYQHRSTTP